MPLSGSAHLLPEGPKGGAAIDRSAKGGNSHLGFPQNSPQVASFQPAAEKMCLPKKKHWLFLRLLRHKPPPKKNSPNQSQPKLCQHQDTASCPHGNRKGATVQRGEARRNVSMLPP